MRRKGFCYSKMPRSKFGVKRNKLCSESLTKAIKLARSGFSVYDISLRFNISKSTLFKYLKLNEGKSLETENVKVLGNDVKKVFTDDEELSLVQYLKTAELINSGLTLIQVRVLAFHFAVAKSKKFPNSWYSNKMAGKHWLHEFRKKYPDLTLRASMGTHGGFTFNRTLVENFFINLKHHMSFWKFSPKNIYHLDQISLPTVSESVKESFTANHGSKGVVMMACVNADGCVIPPMLIYPKKKFHSQLLKGAPVGTIGAGNTSCQLVESILIQFLNHFIEKVQPSPEHPVLLITDCFESHIVENIADEAKEHGIILLTLPPCTSYKIFPLERTVFGLFKTFYHQAAKKYVMKNSKKPFSIYNIAELVRHSFPQAFIPNNIIYGFKLTGIYPLNENTFKKIEFFPSFSSDHSDRNVSNNISSTKSSTLEPQMFLSTAFNFDPNETHSDSSQSHTTPERNPEHYIVIRRKVCPSSSPYREEIIHENKIMIQHMEGISEKMADQIKFENCFIKSENCSSIPSTSESTDIFTNTSSKIKIEVSDESNMPCANCKIHTMGLSMVACQECNTYYHFECISKIHKKMILNRDEENEFICEKCYQLEYVEDSDSE